MWLRPVNVIIAIVLLIIVLALIDNMFFKLGWQPVAPGPPPAAVAPVAGAAPGGAASPAGSISADPPSSASVASAAAAAAVRAELTESNERLTEAGNSVEKALAQLTVWDSEIEPLRDNADGRAIAAHADLARQMAFLLGQPRPFKSDLVQTADRIKSLRSETDRLAALDPPDRLAAGQKAEIDKLHQWSAEAQTVWTDAVERARSITREARRQQALSASSSLPASPPPVPMSAAVASTTPQAAPPEATPSATSSSVSTPSAVTPASTPQPATGPAPMPVAVDPSANSPPAAAALSQDTPPPSGGSPAQGKTLQEKVVEIDDQNKLAELQQRIAKDAERKLIKDREIEARRLLDERLAAEKAKLVEEARSAEVQRVLQPFLVRRNVQPRLAGSSLQMRNTLDDQPMSFSAIEGVGALAETLNGLSVLARIGSHRELTSPRWDFSSSPRTWSSDTQDRLKQAQDLLRRLGPTLVEEKLLSP